MQIIFGIDPGTIKAGFAVITLDGSEITFKTCGTILMDAKAPLAKRLEKLGSELQKLFQIHKPHVTAVERVFLARNVDSAFKLGHARGVCFYEASRSGSKLVEYAAREVKKGITGSGSAEKEQVQLLLRNLMNLGDKNKELDSLDASDALALAYYHALQIQTQEKMVRGGISDFVS